jgi:hypothetical protein
MAFISMAAMASIGMGMTFIGKGNGIDWQNGIDWHRQ